MHDNIYLGCRSGYYSQVVIMELVTTKLMCSVFVAAKMMVYLESSSEKMAYEIATALDESLSGRTIQVCGHSVIPSLLLTNHQCDYCRSAPKCWRLCGKGTSAMILRRLLRPTELPAIKYSPTACHSCPLVTKTTPLQSAPMVTCSQGSTMNWQMKCNRLQHNRGGGPKSTDLPLSPGLWAMTAVTCPPHCTDLGGWNEHRKDNKQSWHKEKNVFFFLIIQRSFPHL